jgi:hypothetical protein
MKTYSNKVLSSNPMGSLKSDPSELKNKIVHKVAKYVK